MKKLRKIVSVLGLDNEDGQGLIEYGLILGLVTILAFVSYTNFGHQTTNMLNQVAESVATIS